MLKSIIAKSITAVASAGFGAAVVVALTSGAPEAKADTSLLLAPQHQSSAKSDRIPTLLKGAACSSRGWPHYEARCQSDLRQPASEARPVRVIALR
jgi:hypothetical protein